MGSKEMVEQLGQIANDVQRQFKEQRRVLTFQEYLELFAADPVRYSRDAARYLRDLFDHYGYTTVKRPWGELKRFRLFDLPFLDTSEARRHALVGQERVQREIYRVLSNFVREGRPNRLLLLYGPNGSAKSTVAACMMLALEHYSSTDEGALYRFHWVFPSRTTLKGAIGFSERRLRTGDASYAHLPDEEIDARLFVEVRDHPLFLLPEPQRTKLVEDAFKRAGAEAPPGHWITTGKLSHKNRQVFDALLTSYEGSLEQVLRHVQVERYFLSRRYRVGAVTIGPQLTVDAGERQITADRSLAALPTALQSVTLFEAFGELIEASGGLLEFSDLLKRPLDAIKYLQLTVETGEVPLRSQNVQVNSVMIGSANEVQLIAFREHPEFESFRGRLELIRTPYLTSWVDEQAIYDAQIAPQVQRHVAPHATRTAAMFAIITRLRRPNPDRYEKPLRELVSELTVMEKADLYGTGKTPDRLDEESAKLLRASIAELHDESDIYPIYEGSIGASPREMRGVLLDAAQDPRYECLSPFAVLDKLDELCEKTNEFIWLQEERQPGGYHDHAGFRESLRRRLLDSMEDEFRAATGLVDEARYQELFDRYITHVSFWVKGEKMRNPVTGAAEDPDERLMQEIESRLGAPDRAAELRHSLMNRIAAWAIDHPGQKIDHNQIFGNQLRRLREAVFGERRSAVARLCRDLVLLLRGGRSGLAEPRRHEVEQMLSRLKQQFGYEETSAADAAAALVRERFAEILS